MAPFCSEIDKIVRELWKDRKRQELSRREQLKRRLDEVRERRDKLDEAFLFESKIDEVTLSTPKEEADGAMPRGSGSAT